MRRRKPTHCEVCGKPLNPGHIAIRGSAPKCRECRDHEFARPMPEGGDPWDLALGGGR